MVGIAASPIVSSSHNQPQSPRSGTLRRLILRGNVESLVVTRLDFVALHFFSVGETLTRRLRFQSLSHASRPREGFRV
jgi:hypothetical protein